MALRSRWTSYLIACTLILAAGCGPRLKYDKEVEVNPGEVQQVFFDAPLVKQAAITVSSPGARVDVYVVRTAVARKAMDDIGNRRKPQDVMTGKEDVEKITLDPVPEKKEFSLLIYNRGTKRATVAVHATGS